MIRSKPEDDKKDEAETTDVKKELKNNTDEAKQTGTTKTNDNETTYDDDKASYESDKDEKAS